MTKAVKIKILQGFKAFAGALNDTGIKAFLRSYFASSLKTEKLSDREKIKLIKALHSIDAVPAEKLRDLANEIFDDAIKELEAQDNDTGD